jgi:hypothetical protein
MCAETRSVYLRAQGLNISAQLAYYINGTVFLGDQAKQFGRSAEDA